MNKIVEYTQQQQIPKDSQTTQSMTFRKINEQSRSLMYTVQLNRNARFNELFFLPVAFNRLQFLPSTTSMAHLPQRSSRHTFRTIFVDDILPPTRLLNHVC